ncbi:MAG: hypothetical protein GWN87_05920, partial [Desulfuromonadales bacterium]|nr:hypothetical protein [Desulfuromonadales bacterium]
IYGSAAIGGVVALRSPDPFDFADKGLSGGTLATAWHGTDSSLHATGLQSINGDGVGALLGISVRDGEEAESAAATDNLDTRDYQRRS